MLVLQTTLEHGVLSFHSAASLCTTFYSWMKTGELVRSMISALTVGTLLLFARNSWPLRSQGGVTNSIISISWEVAESLLVDPMLDWFSTCWSNWAPNSSMNVSKFLSFGVVLSEQDSFGMTGDMALMGEFTEIDCSPSCAPKIGASTNCCLSYDLQDSRSLLAGKVWTATSANDSPCDPLALADSAESSHSLSLSIEFKKLPT